MSDAKRVTYQLRCACNLCRRPRQVTLPEGQEPKEYCHGRMMTVENQWPADVPLLSPRG